MKSLDYLRGNKYKDQLIPYSSLRINDYILMSFSLFNYSIFLILVSNIYIVLLSSFKVSYLSASWAEIYAFSAFSILENDFYSIY